MTKVKDNESMTQQKKSDVQRHVFPLTSDLVFKAVFGRDTGASKAALIALLNLILDRKEDPIQDLVLKNPFTYAEIPAGKQVILDIKAQLSAGEWIDIEMQVQNLPFYLNRILYYAAKLLAEQLESGDNYGTIKKTIVITLTCADYFPFTEKVHTQFHLREDMEGFLMTDHLEFHFIEMNKINIDKEMDEMTPLERACAYLRYAAEPGKEEFITKLLCCKEEAINMAENLLREVSADERMKEMQWAIKMAEMDRQVLLEHAKEQAMEQGLEKGITALLSTLQELEVSQGDARETLISKCQLSAAEADRWMLQFWK